MENNNEYIIAQYNVISNEFSTLLTTSQNVIIINLAITIGILGAMATMLSVIGEPASTIVIVAYTVLAYTGFMGSVCCLRTINIGIHQVAIYEKRLAQIEQQCNLTVLHEVQYFKPLHITLVAFVFFIIVFAAIFACCISKLMLPDKEITTGKILLIMAAIFAVTMGMVYLSEKIHNNVQKKLKQNIEK